MDNKLALTTAVTLAYRETLSEDSGGISSDLIKELMNLIKVSDLNLGNGLEVDTIGAVKSTVVDMLRATEGSQYEKTDLLTRLRINVGDDDKWYESFKKSIDTQLDTKSLNRSITVLRNKVKTLINKETIGKLAREFSSEWNFRHDKITDAKAFVNDFLGKMEPLATTGGAKDTAKIEEMCFKRKETVLDIATRAAQIADGTRMWKTGWQGLNEMTQGGFREGETWVIGALPHKDKTGTSLSIFRQLAQYNAPLIRKEGRIPTLARISLEDPLTNNLRYLYENIRYNETREPVNSQKVSADEMSEYVSSFFEKTGFDVRMARFDPSDWTFRSLFNYVQELENEGCDVQVLMIDYMSMIPTTGCRQGPAGVDLQDLLRRIRNFCAARGILFITPHQLSTEARNLTRGLVPDDKLLENITMKGYWMDSKGLDREFDGAFYIHLVQKGDVWYKHFYRDKHRWPVQLPEVRKSFYMQFPGLMSIPDDVMTEPAYTRKIGRGASNVSSDFFEMA